jgi:eukaryotic-like serine/threonine-protein kinase
MVATLGHHHLGDETIAAMLEGALSDEAVRRARDHIATCDACRSMLSAAIDAERPASASAVAYRVHGAVAPGAVIAGRYQIERLLGEGGMGRVFVARQLGLERRVAVKILRAELTIDRAALTRFQREARLIASLVSEHVVRIHDLGELDTGEPYIIMELLDGEDLAAMLARGPLHPEQARAWILDACSAIGEAHALGIIHRDIKPSNLFVTRQGRLVVLDFGVAKVTGALGPITGAGMLLGSPQYMAPEQIQGAADVDLGADVWSIGATLYHLVTGRPPFVGANLETLFYHILAGPPPALDGVQPDIAYVIARSLTRDRQARFANIAELAATLRLPPEPPSHAVPAPHVARSRPGAAVYIACAALIAIAVVLIATRPWESNDAPAAPKQPTPANVTNPLLPVVDAAERLDRKTITKRLEKRGYSVDVIEGENVYAGCVYLQFQAEKLTPFYENAGISLLDCNDRQIATDHAEQLRKYYAGYGIWIFQRGVQVFTATVAKMGMPKLSDGKALLDAILAPET